ncbi:xylulokinase [Psychromonas aquimarina]|uniref:xylulokinase n=1 Tax=Psychromonas aquimarina TaxID=444919 RepID=UPI00040EB5C5|nr:xylulokinase [Psychromonas aquimarina]
MYLGIDLGTSEVKAIVINGSGDIVASESMALTIQRPFTYWSEQQPEQWWQATQQIIPKLRDKCAQHWAKIKAIGLSGQMHGAVLLDENGKSLRPAILWNDTRCAKECEEFEKAAPKLHEIAGNLAMPGFTAPKLMWVKKHEPEIFSQVKTVLLPKDYLRYQMTGTTVSDMSDSAGTLWLDVEKRDWSDYLLEKSGMHRSQMPSLVEGSDVSAALSPEIAIEWGLADDVVVAGGGGDNAVSAIGVGAVTPGDAFISLGTSGVIFVVNEQYSPEPASAVHAFCHALPLRWHQMSVMLSAASCLQWFCRLVGTNEAELLLEVEQLTEQQKQSAPIFLPYLSGERTPHNDPYATGSFHGMTHNTSRAVLGYSVIEGVSFGLADGLSALQNSKTKITQCSLVGGGARSTFWAQLLADTLDLPIVTHKGGETGGALGAARLARLAAGGSENDVCKKPEVSNIYIANKEIKKHLKERYQTFKDIYQNDLKLRK